MNQDAVATARGRQLAIIERAFLETRVGSLDENFRVVPGGAKHPLNPQRFVTDCIAVTKRCQYLMNGDWHAYLLLFGLRGGPPRRCRRGPRCGGRPAGELDAGGPCSESGRGFVPAGGR